MPPSPESLLPCVVQLGFAGSRRLLEPSPESLESFQRQVQDYLEHRLATLPADIGLARNHFLCGISQIAVGADMLFTLACQAVKCPQRIFLPQHRNEYLEAVGSNGTPDFSPEELEKARELLSSPHIIQERVVSDASDRAGRFEDTNREILRVSDVILCLRRADDAGARRGGTQDLLNQARERNVPTLEIRVDLLDGEARFEEHWRGRDRFVPPALPATVARLDASSIGDRAALPSVADFCGVVKNYVSAQAHIHRERFSFGARLILGTHILATLFATLALALHSARALSNKESEAAESSWSASIHWLHWTIVAFLVIELTLARYWI
jgi:hypothetical protein